jgi:hypothetical protein
MAAGENAAGFSLVLIHTAQNQIIGRNIMGCNVNRSTPSGAVYGLGFIGAAFFFISHATGFWMGVLGFLKAIVWPAFLVYDAFKHLGL